MQVKAESKDRILTVHIDGEIDHHAAHPLIQRIAQEVELATPLQVILDFCAVKFMDSSGIAVVLNTMRLMKQLGGSVRIINAQPQVERVFCAAGMQQMMKKEGAK